MKKGLVAAGVLVAVGLLGVSSASVAVAVTCPEGTPGYGSGEVDSLAECMLDPGDAPDEVWPVVKNIINVVLGILGVVAVGVIILGGFYFLTSQGDAAKVTKGKNTILWGVVGLIIALLAFAIVNFVLGNFLAVPAAEGEEDGEDVSSLVVDRV